MASASVSQPKLGNQYLDVPLSLAGTHNSPNQPGCAALVDEPPGPEGGTETCRLD